MSFSRREMQYFSFAQEMCSYSEHTEFKLGAILVRGNTVISSGFNHKKSHPMQKKYNALRNLAHANKASHKHHLHAEMHALTKALSRRMDLKNVQIYVYRPIDTGDQIGNSRPCAACMAALVDNGIRDFYYTTPNGYAYEYVEK